MTMPEPRDWLVWSYEHDAWWGPGRMGYVKDSRKAGRYTFAEAQAICDQANKFSKVVMEEARHVSTTNVESKRDERWHERFTR